MITFELLSHGKHLPDGYWRRVAPQTSRIEIELGPGDGRFLVESARAHPSTLYVGLEVRAGLARRLIERSDLPDNVRVYHADARFIVEHLLADGSVDAFHVYFPDPWWKKRHYKRRLLTDALIGGLHRSLKVGGAVYLITDVEPLFVEARERFAQIGLAHRDWVRTIDDAAQSSYERKYRRQGRRLCQARFVKETAAGTRPLCPARP